MSPSPAPACPLPLDATAIRLAVDHHLDAFLAERAATACEGRLPEVITRAVSQFLRGGKRLRPLLCAIGNHAASLAPRRADRRGGHHTA